MFISGMNVRRIGNNQIETAAGLQCLIPVALPEPDRLAVFYRLACRPAA